MLGKSLRLPGSVTSDESLSSHAVVEGTDLEAELHRQRLELRCLARKAFWEADNSETIRRAMLRRSHPMRGPFHPGDWVLYWVRKNSPNRLASGMAWTRQSHLANETLDILDEKGDNLIAFTSLETTGHDSGPPLAEHGLPYIEQPLECNEQQAFCLEIPVKAKSYKQCLKEPQEQMSLLASMSKRARTEVYLKDLTPQERQMFNKAKDKKIQCWLQTSAIKAVLRRSLNPDQILRSRWILTWKPPEPGESQHRAKARLVVLGFQDPKLVEVMRDAPTLSREGRAIVLQSVASAKFTLTSFDIKTAFLRGKADANNPLAMEPPPELRQALNLKDSEVCQLLGNAYGRVDAPLLFYKELCKQLLALGFTRHPLEPCVFMLYSGQQLSGVLGVHVDDGVGGG